MNCFTLLSIFLFAVSQSRAIDIQRRFGESECEDLIPFAEHCDKAYMTADDYCNKYANHIDKQCDIAFRKLTNGCNKHEGYILQTCGKKGKKCKVMINFLDITCNQACVAISDYCSDEYDRMSDKCEFINCRLEKRCQGIYGQYEETCEKNLDPYNWAIQENNFDSIYSDY